MAAPTFWGNQESAQAAVAELKAVKAVLKPLDEALQAADDLEAMLEMGEEDEGFAAEVPGALARLERMVAELEIKALLNGRWMGIPPS